MKKETIYPEFELSVSKPKKNLLSKDKGQTIEISTLVRKEVDGKHYLTRFVGKHATESTPTTEDYLACINDFNTAIYKFMLADGFDEKAILDEGSSANQSELNRVSAI